VTLNATRERIVVAGTGTEVGKTWTAVKLIEIARTCGLRVAARKPAQSYSREDASTDADLLARASGERPHEVCPAHRWYPVPMAPPMAADVLGLPRIQLDALLAETNWPSDVELALIETAGGLCSPISHDADNLRLVEKLAPTRVLLVADAGLGTLNSVRLCLRALGEMNTTVFLNRYDSTNDLHRRNAEWLRADGVDARFEIASLLER
jgi:dethiobiotin synthetase